MAHGLRRGNKMVEETKTIAESSGFVILDKYIRKWERSPDYQTEHDLEKELVQDLVNQGYEFLPDLRSPEAMLDNVRVQLENLNNIQWTDAEWQRFVDTYLDKANEGVLDKTRKLHDDSIHDFVFDDGRIYNIRLFDEKNLPRNKVQVIKQFEQSGTHANRYDVTILVNGLPLVQIELKKRGVAIREAFNQVHRYTKESFNSENSLYKYLQIFVISNGTDTRYFANTTKRDKNSFDFTIHWAKFNNEVIKDLRDFTATFFDKNTLLNVLFRYSVFDAENTLLIMRPYQIAATERILWKIQGSFEAKNWKKPAESGGYIWHTTGSGKTLTSFKTARLACDLDFIDHVFFVVDRKDLDFQTMKEYQRFSPDSVNGSENTAALKRNLQKKDNKIIVTTIQKLHKLMKSEENLAVYQKKVVFIFDECHRSQFGKAQILLKKRFQKYFHFGFTGTPIFPDNASGSETTPSVFGPELHSYVITHAIRDEKVLKFKVDYNDVRPQFKKAESEQDLEKMNSAEIKEALSHPNRLREISQYILKNYPYKTHRLQGRSQGFNAMFAVSSVEMAKLYYEILRNLQVEMDNPLKIATIFSFAPNEEQEAHGNIPDENFDDLSSLKQSSKEFLSQAMDDYNGLFKTSFSLDSQGFQNYYRDVAKRVKSQEVDLLIVVGMFLTGFDAPTLNTLFVDKNLRYHGLIQAYSRTNRIYNSTKTFGNIVCFRDLEKATIEAIKLFGKSNTKNIILEKSYKEYMNGFTNQETGEKWRGFTEVAKDLEERFPDPSQIVKESDKKEFAQLFGEYLKIENKLQNYDEFVSLKALQNLDLNDEEAVKTFKEDHYLKDEDFNLLKSTKMPTERQVQDYRSTYNDIRDWLRKERKSKDKEKFRENWDDVVFEVELLRSQEINLDYILKQLKENSKKAKDKEDLIEHMRGIIRSSMGHRAKESLFIDFINQTDLEALDDDHSVMEAFFTFARKERKKEAEKLIQDENLNAEPAKRYMTYSLRQKFASDEGTELNEILPKMSPLNPEYLAIKERVFQKMVDFVEKFEGVGGSI